MQRAYWVSSFLIFFCFHYANCQNDFDVPQVYFQNICSGASSVVSVNPESGVLFNWQNPENLQGPFNLPSCNFNALVTEFDTVTFQYIVYRRTANGNELLDTVNVFVLPQPLPFQFPFSDTTICFGQSIAIELNLPNGYSFANTIVFVSPSSTQVSDSVYVLQPEVLTIFTFNYVDNNGCRSDSSILKISVFDSPPVTIEPIAQVLCITSDSVTLLGSPPGGFFSGPGIIDTTFVPSLAGTGFHVIRYSFSVGNCEVINEITTTVIEFPDFNNVLIPNLCKSDSSIDLAELTIFQNAVIVGPGVIDNILFPNLLDDGVNQVVFSVDLGQNCLNTDTVLFFIKPSPPKPNIVTFTGFNEFCFGDSLLVGVNPYPNILWNTGDTVPGFLVYNTQTLQVQYTNGLGCKQYDTLVVLELDPILLNLSSPTYPNGFEISTFGASDGSILASSGGGNPPFTFVLNGNNVFTSPVNQLTAGTYTIGVNDSRGCRTSDTITLNQPNEIPIDPEKPNNIFGIPNSFTPNGDGFNDFWVFKNLDLAPQNKLSVFNRWGQLVYSANGYNNNWNGEVNGRVTEAVYFYVFENLSNNKAYEGFVNTVLK